jgi:hypothetical protein
VNPVAKSGRVSLFAGFLHGSTAVELDRVWQSDRIQTALIAMSSAGGVVSIVVDV